MKVVGKWGPLPKLGLSDWRARVADPRKGKYDDECVLAWINTHRREPAR